MDWTKAVVPVAGGCRLLLEVVPGARAAAFPAGFDPWRARITVRLRAPAREGRANVELLAASARFFGVAGDGVRLVGGAAARRKDLQVSLGRDEVLRRLAQVLGAGRVP